MKKFILIFSLLLMSACGRHLVDGRFDAEVDMHFGPNPEINVEDITPLLKPPTVIPSENTESKTGWWVNK